MRRAREGSGLLSQPLNSGADRVRSLMEENVQLDRENHDLAFQLWVWSMACGTGEEQQAQRTAELLERRLQREATANA